MRVIHVNNTDLPGRRFNGYDLLSELESRGVSGKQAVLMKSSNSSDVISLLNTPEDAALQRACTAVEQRYSMNDLIFPWGAVLTETAEFKNADLVHLHLIHNEMISLFDVPRIVGLKPCVWTFHDAWPMTGHCVYPRQCERWLTGCEICPSLDAHFPMLEDRASRMWKVKQRVLADIDVDVVVASEFMLEMVQRSPLTAHLENVHLIPFGIDTNAFLPEHEKLASRKALGIPKDDFVVLFRSTASEFKGLRYIIEALSLASPSRPTTLVTVDQKGLVKSLESKYNVIELGWVNEQALLPRAFSASDVLLMPSTAEAFGLMALEAMAASRPVICFEGTSLPGVTHAPECGIAVPMCDAVALRSAIDSLAADASEIERRGRLGRALADEHHSHELYLDRMASLYRGVLERRG